MGDCPGVKTRSKTAGVPPKSPTKHKRERDESENQWKAAQCPGLEVQYGTDESGQSRETGELQRAYKYWENNVEKNNGHRNGSDNGKEDNGD